MSGLARPNRALSSTNIAVVRLERSNPSSGVSDAPGIDASHRSRSSTMEGASFASPDSHLLSRVESQRSTLRRRRGNSLFGRTAGAVPENGSGIQGSGAAASGNGTDGGARADELESVYNNYATIDWIRDQAVDRRKRAELDRLNKRVGKDGELVDGPAWSWLSAYRQFYKVQTWLLLLIVSAVSGTIAGGLDIAVEWLSDVKLGSCKGAFYLSLKRCCADQPAPLRPTPAPDVGPRCQRWVSWSTMLMGGVSDQLPKSVAVDYSVYIALSALLAGVAALGVRYISQHAAGSGIPETKAILGGFIVQGFTSMRSLVAKLGVIFSAASGLNLGKEGPLVHIACCVAAATATLFPRYATNEAKRRELFSAAAATGVSVAFGAPIGGVLFSLEEVSYYFPHKTLWRTFFGAAVGAFALHYANPFTDKLVLFQVTYSTPWYSFELIPFLMLGVLGGAMGGLFVRLNVAWCALRRRTVLSRWPIAEAVSLAALTAIINYFSPFMRRNAAEELGRLFTECPSAAAVQSGHAVNDPLCSRTLWPAPMVAGSLVLAGLARLFLTVLTFGTRVPAGLFIPSLGIGALFGRALGLAMEQLWLANDDWFLFAPCPTFNANAPRCVVPGVYALIGAAAMLSGVTRMTVSLVVIVLELTGNIDYIIPLMLVTSVAKWVAEAICRDGIYDVHIELRGFPFLDNKHTVRGDTKALSLMTPASRVCALNVGVGPSGHPNHREFDQDNDDDDRNVAGTPASHTVDTDAAAVSGGHDQDDDHQYDDEFVEELPPVSSGGPASSVSSAGASSVAAPSRFVDALATAEQIHPKAMRTDGREPPCPGGCRPKHGHTVRSLTRFLRRHPHSGFPVLTSDGYVAGYLSRAALTRALLLIHTNPFVDAHTPVVFEPPTENDDHLADADDDADAAASQGNRSSARNSHRDINGAPAISSSSSSSSSNSGASDDQGAPAYVEFDAVLDLSSFLDEVPLCVWPRAPIDVLVDMFAKLGSRIVLVVEMGKLVGVLTKKDILRMLGKSHSFFVPQAYNDVTIQNAPAKRRTIRRPSIAKMRSVN